MKCNDAISTVMITGASSGLGLAMARQLAVQKGHQLVITGRDREKLDKACDQLQALASHSVVGIQLDQGDKNSIDASMKELVDRQCLPGTLIANIGVNSAHSIGFRKIHRSAYSDIEAALVTNVLNTIYLVMQCLPHMQRCGGGRIALIGSQAYQYGLPGQVAYNVSKSALLGLYHTLGKEYPHIQSFLFDLGMLDNARNSRFRDKLQENPAVTMLDENDVAISILTDIMSGEHQLHRNIP